MVIKIKKERKRSTPVTCSTTAGLTSFSDILASDVDFVCFLTHYYLWSMRLTVLFLSNGMKEVTDEGEEIEE